MSENAHLPVRKDHRAVPLDLTAPIGASLEWPDQAFVAVMPNMRLKPRPKDVARLKLGQRFAPRPLLIVARAKPAR